MFSINISFHLNLQRSFKCLRRPPGYQSQFLLPWSSGWYSEKSSLSGSMSGGGRSLIFGGLDLGRTAASAAAVYAWVVDAGALDVRQRVGVGVADAVLADPFG